MLKRIMVDPRIVVGESVIKGMRIAVDTILELLAAGMKPKEIAEDHYTSLEDIRATPLYANKDLSREEAASKV